MRKGVYPNDYVDSPERLKEMQLPPKEAFYPKNTLVMKIMLTLKKYGKNLV